MTYEEQYLTELDDLLTNHSKWVYNERTGERVLQKFGVMFEYGEESPLLTVNQSFPVMSVAEELGYLRGYDNASQFDNIGARTWHGNTNENESWLSNPYRKGEGDLGRAYGVVARDFGGIDTVKDVLTKIQNRDDDRGLIITYWKPDDFDKACLRPCKHTMNFMIDDGTINLFVSQRSCDSTLGLKANSIGCWFLLQLAARISGLKVGVCKHFITNYHLYESHYEGAVEMLSRNPLEDKGKLKLADWVEDVDSVLGETNYNKHAREYISVEGYEHLGKIDFKMAV